MKRSLFTLILVLIVASVQAENLVDAVLRAPMVAAALQRQDAASQRINASGRWADPQVEGMYANKDTPEDSMPMWGVTVQQPLPKYGERSAEKAKARAALKMAEADVHMVAGELAAETARTLAERDAARQRVDLIQHQLERTERALSALETRLGTGQGRLSESLVLQSRLTSLRLEIEKESLMVDETERDARQMLGLDSSDPLPLFSAPVLANLNVDHAPEIISLMAKKDEARAMTEMARAGSRPMSTMGLFFEREETGLGDEDTLGLTFMTDLPWNSRRSARAEILAAQADLAGRENESDALRRRFEADRIRAERLIRLAEQTKTTVQENQQRLDREYDAWIQSMGTGGMIESSSTLMLIDLLDRSTELLMQSIDAETASRSAQADLWRYQPMLEGK